MTATIELNSARRKLQSALGDNQKTYFAHLRAWFRKRATKEEFDIEARKLLSADNSHLHNEFLLAILNKCQTLASFTLVTSPTIKAAAGGGALPSSVVPPSSVVVSPSSVFLPGGLTGLSGRHQQQSSTQDLDGRLKVGSLKRRTKSNRPVFDQRFQPASPEGIPDCDDSEPYDPDERSLMFAFKEPTLPDANLIGGRLLIAAWDEGLDGSINDPAAIQLMKAAVDQLLRKIIMSTLMDKSGYKTYRYVLIVLINFDY
jgi:transcriptional adapter 1